MYFLQEIITKFLTYLYYFQQETMNYSKYNEVKPIKSWMRFIILIS